MSATILDAFEYALTQGYAGTQAEFTALMSLALKYEKTTRKDLGRVTAYGYAKSKGYTGTEEEFAELMASYATVAEEAADSASEAEGYAEDSQEWSVESEAWSTGQRNGVDVDSEDETYHNNSKYYSEQSLNSAEDSEAYAFGKRGGVDVASSDPAYHKNAKYYSEEAAATLARFSTDTTLTIPDRAADAKKTGDEIEGLKAAISSPLVITDPNDFEDANHQRVYVYAGTTTASYTEGDWYYWDGDGWESGGPYNSVAVYTDDTLSVQGQAADAAAVGVVVDAVTDLNSAVGQVTTKLVIKKSENLLNDADLKVGYYSAEGIYSDNSDYCNIAIEVSPGDILSWWIYNSDLIGSSNINARFVTAYKEDGTIDPSKGSSANQTSYTVPTGITKIIVTFLSSYFSLSNRPVMIVNGTTNTKPYRAYYTPYYIASDAFVPGLSSDVKTLNANAFYNVNAISDNALINNLIRELYAKDIPVSVAMHHITIMKNYYNISTEKYINEILFEYPDGVNYGVYYSSYNTQDESVADLKSVYHSGNVWSVINWDAIETEYTRLDVSDVKFGAFNELSTCPIITNKFFSDANNDVIENDCIVKVVDYDEVATETADGTRKLFSFKNPIDSADAILVYKNGLKLFNGVDYTCNYHNKYVKFVNAPRAGDVIGFHYSTKWKTATNHYDMIDCIEDNDNFIAPYRKYIVNAYQRHVGQTYQYAENYPDPDDQDTNVMAYVCKGRGENDDRIRCQIGMRYLRANELDCSVDVYIPSASFACLETYANEIDWLTLQEYWTPVGSVLSNNKKANDRITVGIGKKADDPDQSKLYFFIVDKWEIRTNTDELLYQGYIKANGDTVTTTFTPFVDDRVDHVFPIPLDTWITMHSKIKVGETGGYFLFEVAVNGTTTKLFDGNIPIQIPIEMIDEYLPSMNENVIDGTTSVIKMYTSSSVADHILNNSTSGEMRTLWKNLKYSYKQIVRNP